MYAGNAFYNSSGPGRSDSPRGLGPGHNLVGVQVLPSRHTLTLPDTSDNAIYTYENYLQRDRPPSRHPHAFPDNSTDSQYTYENNLKRKAQPNENFPRHEVHEASFRRDLPSHESRRDQPVYENFGKEQSFRETSRGKNSDYEDKVQPPLPTPRPKIATSPFGLPAAPGVTETLNHVRDIMEENQEIAEALDELRKEENEDATGARRWQKLIPILAAAFVQMVAGFYFATTNVTLFTEVVKDVFKDSNKEVALVREMFQLFSALASASSVPLIRIYGYRKLAAGGAILMIFSCMSSSLVSKGDILIVPYSVFGGLVTICHKHSTILLTCIAFPGVAYGLLRTSSLVATLDYLPNRRVLALTIAAVGYTVGGFVGTIVYYLEMKKYVKKNDWKNNLQIIQVTAILALLCGSLLKAPSKFPGTIKKVFKYPPFYILLFAYLIDVMGMTVLPIAIISLPRERKFSFYKESVFLNPVFAMYGGQLLTAIVLFIVGKCHPKGIISKAFLLAGVVILVIGGATMPHEPAYNDFWPLVSYSVVVGVGLGFNQIMMPLAMIDTVGRDNNKITIPFLNFVHDLGGLMGNVVIGEIGKNGFSLDAALYVAGGSVILFGITAVICWFRFPQWPEKEEENLGRKNPVKLNTDFDNPAFDGMWKVDQEH